MLGSLSGPYRLSWHLQVAHDFLALSHGIMESLYSMISHTASDSNIGYVCYLAIVAETDRIVLASETAG
jgi:hypothetical protein